MSFRDEAHANRALQAFVRSSRLPALRGMWDLHGPARDAFASIGVLSSGEGLILRVALDIWNGTGNANVSDLVHILDKERLDLVLSLLAAVNAGSDAVDEWIAKRGEP